MMRLPMLPHILQGLVHLLPSETRTQLAALGLSLCGSDFDVDVIEIVLLGRHLNYMPDSS
jgi:hypothetical protein